MRAAANAIVSVILIASSCGTVSKAATLGPGDVSRAAASYVNHVTADARPDASVDLIEAYEVDGEALAYVVHLANGGYCLCACDDLLLPVQLYCPRGAYDPYNGITQCVLKGIAEGALEARAAGERNDSRLTAEDVEVRRAYWNALLAGDMPASLNPGLLRPDEPDTMVLDLTSEWGQGSPFNDLCPELTPGVDEHTVVGCGGTAIAQIMYYWKWPPSGTGYREKDSPRRVANDWMSEPCATDPGEIPARFDGRLEWTSSGGGQLRMNAYWDVSMWDSAVGISSNEDYQAALASLWDRLTLDPVHYEVDFSSATYDWDLMEDVCDDPPGAGEEEVSKLSYHAAVAVNSRFGIWGTAHNVDRFPEAFVDNFRYDPDQATTSNIDPNLAISEIRWMRPIGIAGCGHTWVVDGYKVSTNQFHMNFGWGEGTHDVWNTLDQWCSSVSRFGIYIAPESIVRFAGGGTPGEGTPLLPYADIEEAVAASPDGSTIILQAHQEHRFTASTASIQTPLTLQGYNITLGTSAREHLHLHSDLAGVRIHEGGGIALY